MPDSTSQLILLIYEYLYNRGNKLEFDYLKALEDHYRNMFCNQPDRRVRADELVRIIEYKVRHDHFMEIQSEMYEILSLYRPGTFNNPVDGISNNEK